MLFRPALVLWLGLALSALFASCASAPAPSPESARGAAGLAALLHPQPLRWSGRPPGTSVARAAVVIAGSTHAAHPEWDLPSAERSAERMAAALVQHCGVAPAALTRLARADVHGDAVTSALVRAADTLVGTTATLFVYYAGHGFVDATGDPMLFGHFTTMAGNGGFTGGLLRRELVRAVSQARQRGAARGVAVQVILVVDACRVALAAPPPKALLTEAPLWELWSTRPGMYARAGADTEVFLFTRELTEAMAALAQTAAEVDLRRLAEEARLRTQRASSGQQDPELVAPRFSAEAPTAIMNAGVRFRLIATDAISATRIAHFSVRVGTQTFLAEDGEALVEVPQGTQHVEVFAPEYLTQTYELHVGAERQGGVLEAVVYPALTLVSGRITPPAVLTVRAVGGRMRPRDNYHLMRTVTSRDGAFALRVPDLGDGLELEFVAEDRVVQRTVLPRTAAAALAIPGAPRVPQLEVAVALDAPAPAAELLAQATPMELGEPVALPRAADAGGAADLARVRTLLHAARFGMARDALAAAATVPADEELRQEWLAWLELRAARAQTPAAVHKRLLDLSARGAPESLRSALAQALLERLVEERAWDGVLDLFAACQSKQIVATPAWRQLEQRTLPVALEQVLRAGLARGVQSGDWASADRACAALLAAENLWVLDKRPALAELRNEVQRERVPPACRQAFERGNVALAEARHADARAFFLVARAEANEHYRALIDERLEELDARVFAAAMHSGTKHELDGRPTDALWAYAKAYGKDQRAAESLRRVLRTGAPRDADFDRAYDRLLDETIARAQATDTPAGWRELSDLFSDAPRAQAALTAAMVAPWADVVDSSVGPSGLPCAVRDRRSGIVLRLIEPGAFLMGAPDADREATDVERPRHRVQLTRPYWLAETEVTWEQWRVFAAETGAGGGLEAASARHPVAGLSWVQAERFCQHFGLRLPTEAEWEYAARAGGSEPYRRFAWGDDPRQAVGNFYGADEARRDDDVFLIRDGFVGAAPVGTYGKNGWGLADMLGNVREWCADAFVRDAYAGRRDGAVDPKVEAGSAPTVVVRGGSFQDGPRNAGIATRLEAARDVRLPWIGLRVARDVW